MNIDQKIIERLDELNKQGVRIVYPQLFPGDTLSHSGTTSESLWVLNCLDVLRRAFGPDSDYYKRFRDLYPEGEQVGGRMSTRPHSGLGIILSAKQVYERGYLIEVRTLVTAEVFTDLLDQAEELFDKGYHLPAAVVAGSVLEDALRKLCDRHNMTVPDPQDATKPKEKPTMNDYNVELARAKIYEKAIQKQVDASAAIRNHAAHGERDKFTPEQVRLLIDHVRFFMSRYFST